MADKKSKYGSGMKNTYKQFDDLTIDDSPKDMAMSYYKTHIEGKGLMHRIKNSVKIKNLGAGMNESAKKKSLTGFYLDVSRKSIKLKKNK